MGHIVSVSHAVNLLRLGEMIIVVDDASREDEGDLVIAAEHASAQSMNFMMTHGRGLICLAMPGPDLELLGVKLLVHPAFNRTAFATPFCMPIDARAGTSTGVSAADRSVTIHAALRSDACPADFVCPGHMHTLAAQPGGVLVRRGHTEASVELARLAGSKPAAVICEIVRPDGEMARLPDLELFAGRHQMAIVTIESIVEHVRNQNDSCNVHLAESLVLG